MKRSLGFFALALLICVVATDAFVRGQDRVDRRDKKGGTVGVVGKILEESAAGVKMKVQGLNRDETIPSNEISKVTYAEFPIGVSTALNKLGPAEEARNLPVLLKGYEGIQAMPELKTTGPGARRYIDYRVASLRAAAAEGDEVKAAVKGLVDFIAAHPDSWEYPHAARQLGRLQADLGDYAAATKTFEALEKATNVPAEFKLEATAGLIDIAFQSDNYDQGRKRIAAVAKDPNAPAALKARADLYQLGLDGARGDLAATVKKIEDAIAKTQDPGMRGLAYNVLGDVYRAKNQRRDAMWSYLWVDQVYNQDRGEHIKAMTRLIKIFEEDKDEDKVKLYKEKLARSR
jgi:TolA-binding protein